jgi:mRNA-degrading endonuclease toxin of MazEF toxin-antitoxin module
VTGLARDSVANASQLATVNKSDLAELVATLPVGLLAKVSQGIQWFLQLGA